MERPSDTTPVESDEPDEPIVEEVAHGRSSATPFLVLGGVAATIWAAVVLVAGGVLLLWWLV
jgi:hypothetical protein